MASRNHAKGTSNFSLNTIADLNLPRCKFDYHQHYQNIPIQVYFLVSTALYIATDDLCMWDTHGDHLKTGWEIFHLTPLLFPQRHQVLYRCSAHLQQLLKTATNNFTFLPINSGSWIRKILPCQLINWLEETDARNASVNWLYSTIFYFENNHLMDKKCISSLLVSNLLIFALVEKVTLLSAAKNRRRIQQ